MTIVSPPPTPGDQVGPYVLHELLGVGGMATVYRAVDDTGGVCAVKILHPGKAQTDEVKRFEREFLALRDLRHPSVVQVYEAGMAGDYPWIAMEYVDGSDLGSLVDRWTANPPVDQFAQAERILRGLCEGLAMIHDEGLIHRDLKPSNVLVTSSGEAKITDFGVVKASGAFTTQLTVAGKLVGTVAFMSPEQITGDPVTPASDLYSLGAVLYVLLALRRPIEADNIAGYLARHITETPRPPSEYDSNVPPHLERICMQMLKKEANQRPVSARQVLAKLDGDGDSPSKVLHGREREVEWFRDCLSEVERGAGGLAIVVGELGSGRTALLEAFVEQAQSRELAVAAASGARTELVGQLARQLPARAVGAASWLGLGTAATLQPTLIVIDDMDQMDSEMISGLTSMLRQRVAIEGMPIFVVGSVESTTGTAQGLCTGADTGLTTDQLVLGGLERSAIIALVRDQGVGGAVAAALGRRLTGELAGMPGAVLEQISALVQTGWLVPTPDGGLRSGCTMDALRNDPLPLPDRIRRKEAARIEGLGPDARHLFDVLVVLDMEATLELVGEIAALDPTILGRALHELSQAQLIRERSEGIHDIVSLRGDRNRDVAYQLISKNKRTVLHQSVAASLRRRSRRRSGTFAEVIASHLLSGGQVGEAYPMLLVAAETTLRAGKSKQAAKLLEKAERARQVAETNMEEKVQIRCQRRLYTLWGSLYHRMSQPRKALEAWKQALSVAREEGSAESIARAQAGMGLSRVAIGEVVAASSGLEQALGKLPQGDPMWAEAAEALAGARLSRGDVDGARRLWGELLELGKEMGKGSVHARALAGLSLISLVKGRYGEGQDGLENAIFRMRDQANQNLLPDAILWLAEFLYAQGYLEKAREYALEADGVARNIPRLRLCTTALGMASQALFDLGVPHDARTLAQDSATMARAQGAIETIGSIASILPAVRVFVGLGAFEEAQKLLPNMPPANTREMVGVSDPMGGLLAIKSRVVLKRNPTVAVALARQVVDRPVAILPWAGTRHLLDAAYTLVNASDERAEEVVRKIIERVSDSRFRLLKMEAGLLAESLGIEREAADEAHKILNALDHELGSPEGFKSRWLDPMSS